MRRPSPSIALLLLPLAAAPAQSEALREKVSHALDAARPALLAHLDRAATQPARPGELALVLLAAIHDGVDASEREFTRAVDRLAKGKPDQTYDLALRLMVMELLPAFPDRDELAREDTRDLLENRDDGAFGYTPGQGQWDLSNTQYAALGLRAAKAMGVKVDRRVWAALGREIGDQQDSSGGFGYRRVDSGFQSYASMTAAGIAVLAVCRQALGDENDKDSPLTKRIARGWRWFERNVDVIGSPNERWSYYFHYGLERAAILCDVEQVGGVSWYERGAEMLCDAQLSGGGWISETDVYMGDNLSRRRGSSVATAFAVLFLRRKFQRSSGPITPHVVTLPAIGPNSKPQDVADCAAELARRGKAAMPDLLWALRSEIENQRRAAATALAAIAGKDFGYDPAQGAEPNREAIRQAELWYLRNR